MLVRCAPVWGERLFAVALSLVCLVPVSARAQNSAVRPVEGLREATPAVHAFTGARLIVAPGQEIPRGTLVVRDGRIVAIGADVVPPADARVWPSDGKTIYPGLFDAYSEQSVPDEAAKRGAPHWNALVTPQLSMAELYRPDGGLNGKLRQQGVVARLVAPAHGVLKGRSAVVVTDDSGPDRAVVRADVAQHLRLTLAKGQRHSGFPNSPMGAVALARQTLLDADWHREAWNAAQADPLLPRPETNDALAALAGLSGSRRLVIADASDEQFALRADQFAREFALRLVVRGSGREYRRLDAIRAAGRPVLTPLDFPPAPYVATAEAAADASLDDLLHWDFAPENPARLDRAGVTIAFMTHGLKEPGEYLSRIRKAVRRGLSKEAALRALTTTPAQLYEVDASLGSLAVGKNASFLIASGDLFDDGVKVLETWVAGKRFEIEKQASTDPRGEWKVDLQGPPGAVRQFVWKLTGEALKPQGEAIVKAADGAEKKIGFEHLQWNEGRLGAVLAAAELGRPGKAHFSGLVVFAADGGAKFQGELLWPDGARSPLVAVRSPPAPAAPATPPAGSPMEKPAEKPGEPSGEKTPEKPAEKPAEKPPEKPATPASKLDPPATAASFPVNYPLGPFGRSESPPVARRLLLRNAVIWTCGPAGKLDRGALLIDDGRIVAVGPDADVVGPPGAVVVDLKGAHLSPGIIDCHSHMATDGGVNESTQSNTAEVRIGDFIDANDITIYRQLAGGVTAAHILHGSANTIGGQCQLIKLRWGELPEAIKFHEAPPTIKFALGENVKQSNWGDRGSGRYPQSRMGVEAFLGDSFQAAREYRERQARWRRDRQGLPPRRDLELDALVEILEARRWIHCHSYRQDEILMFLRIMEAHGVRVATLQHILEGYKVADVMARHGASGSSFSDWWAYKFEVFDAIPYNASLMHRAGVVVSLNSDDRELARHLNHEAAKAIKYGGVPEIEALKLVTLNPAKQLMVDRLVGSLEPGKQADFVVWNGSPLSNFSRCEQTWIDGRKYFDREEDRRERRTVDSMRATLVQKVLASGEAMRDAGDAYVLERDLWARDDEFCRAGGATGARRVPVAR